MDERPQELTAQDEGPITPALREMIDELDRWLAAEPEETLAERVLPFATEWILRDVEGLDVDRYTEEARVFVLATPLSDRVLLRFPSDVAYWVGQRMLVNERHEPEPELAQAILDSARALIAERADLLEAEGFGRVAAGFRAVLNESAGGVPPADLVWSALALRIAEPFLDNPLDPDGAAARPSPPPSEPPEPGPE